jgi:hypothetical protein
VDQKNVQIFFEPWYRRKDLLFVESAKQFKNQLSLLHSKHRQNLHFLDMKKEKAYLVGGGPRKNKNIFLNF